MLHLFLVDMQWYRHFIAQFILYYTKIKMVHKRTPYTIDTLKSVKIVSAFNASGDVKVFVLTHTSFHLPGGLIPCDIVVWNTECSPERGPEWAGMRLRRVWLESAQERPWKPGVLRPGSALLARERGLSGRASPVCCIEVCIGIVYWSCVRPGFACPDPSCVCGERYQPSCVCDGAMCADVRCVCSSIWAYKGRMATVSGVHCR